MAAPVPLCPDLMWTDLHRLAPPTRDANHGFYDYTQDPPRPTR